MNHAINPEGLARLIRLELTKLVPRSKAEARQVMRARMGAYDDNSKTIDAGVDSYFACRASRSYN